MTLSLLAYQLVMLLHHRGMTMGDIARELRLSRATLYRRIDKPQTFQLGEVERLMTTGEQRFGITHEDLGLFPPLHPHPDTPPRATI